MNTRERISHHLANDYTEPIRDPIWSNIHLSEAFKAIVNTPVVQKLNRIKQLGPAYHVYPGATHTRLNHSFGVFFLAKKIIRSFLKFEETAFLTLEGVKAFLAAALLHDLGHFPFAHSLKELPLTTHEILTGDIILESGLAGLIKEQVQTDPQRIAAIINEKIPLSGDDEILFFRRILSGVLDPDKLDYLNRDAFFCGVPYGFQDTDFIIDQIVPHKDHGIALKETGLPGVENVLFSKYLMYRSVYWHKTVRIATAMIKKAIILGMKNGSLTPSELYRIDDERFTFLVMEKHEPFFKIAAGVPDRKFFKAVYETDWQDDNPLHKEMSSLNFRTQKEKEIAGILSKALKRPVPEEFVIIDVPEPISFEIGLPILVDGTFLPFHEAPSVFSLPVVSGFQKILRKVRLIVEPGLAVSDFPFAELLE